MSRKIVEYNLAGIKGIYPDLSFSKVRLFIDMDNHRKANEITNVLAQYKKKFHRALWVMLNNKYDKDLYSQEGKDVTAIKFKGKFKRNLRIYCREVFQDGKKIILITTYKKEVYENSDDESIRQIIKNIKDYQYEIPE